MLFYNPKKVFLDIREEPDYNGILFTGIISLPFVIISTLILYSKISFNTSDYFPKSLISLVKFASLTGTIVTFAYNLMITWIFLAFFMVLANKLFKKKYTFREFLPATSYVLIPLILIQILDVFFYTTLQPITINLSTTNTNTNSPMLNMTNKLYVNPIFLSLFLLIMLFIVILLSFMVSTYFDVDMLKSFMVSLTYYVFELIRIFLLIIFLPIFYNIIQFYQTLGKA